MQDRVSLPRTVVDRAQENFWSKTKTFKNRLSRRGGQGESISQESSEGVEGLSKMGEQVDLWESSSIPIMLSDS